MASVCHPGSGRITASFGPVAVHYQVGICVCPSRHAWRKGAVEKSARTPSRNAGGAPSGTMSPWLPRRLAWTGFA